MIRETDANDASSSAASSAHVTFNSRDTDVSARDLRRARAMMSAES